MRKPNFFIVGAPKCGTTAMYTYLKQHPDIFMPEAKEPCFFGKDLTYRIPRITRRQYLDLFRKAGSERAVGEASTSYLYSREAAREIYDFNPLSRIIIMLRNPVDVLYSYHSQLLYLGSEEIQDFEHALEAEKDRKQGRRIPRGSRSLFSLLYKERVRFTEQVGRYLEVFGQENVHVILFDEFIGDTARIFRETLEFLGVDGKFKTRFGIVNPNTRVKSRLFRNVIRGYPTRLIARHLLPAKIRKKGFDLLSRWNTVIDDRPPLDSLLRKRLEQEFAPEVISLSELIGRDLRHWLAETGSVD
jgi:ribosomal protein S17E